MTKKKNIDVYRRFSVFHRNDNLAVCAWICQFSSAVVAAEVTDEYREKETRR